ncbi:MAG TPA: sigma-54 dependent transcriptional regulator [Candidatus Polarisedimenticolaceae bacterium]|nr:sigma-54 dependent transcriptional regulator [Candidatus Polarisedimenticolaceae bacterium]
MRAPSILVVDDDVLAARYMKLALSKDYADVRCVESGAEALLSVEARAPDLVVTDLRMPSMDGLELLTQLKQRHPEIAVILVTVEDDVAIVVEALQRGALNYLVKPVAPAVLVTAVRKALDRTATASTQGHEVTELVGVSDAIARVRELVALAARGDANVLITGETGTGKDLVARAIHRLSPLAERSFVAHNCAVTPAELFESEFFGHRRGAFTGADRDHAGLLKEADGGVLFLDELECLSPPHQAKLLRVLDDGVVRPVGSAQSHVVSVRVLSATNCLPERMIEDGTLRQDLYYRLRGFEVRLPPLCERREDVRALAAHFLAGRGATVMPDAIAALESFAWPGNVRQLRSVLVGAAQAANGGIITARHLGLGPSASDGACSANGSEEGTLKHIEREAILRAYRQARGNQVRAARALGIHRTTLRRKMEELGIKVGPPDSSS